MSDAIYRPLIEDMRWSYSRIKSFHECPYQWYMKYILDEVEEPTFYASYGSFMHKLIEKYYRKELSKDDMLEEFLCGFSENVKGVRPKASTVEKYIVSGVEYLSSFQPFPFQMIDVEKKVLYDIEGKHFIGFIDYLGEKDGELYIVDNKSRDLKPRSKRKKPTINDQDLDEMLVQLYLYAAAVKQEYGKFPKALCFNCFKIGNFIKEPFNEDAYNNAIQWAIKSIDNIADENEFNPNIDYFKCNWLCGLKDECIYFEMR